MHALLIGLQISGQRLLHFITIGFFISVPLSLRLQRKFYKEARILSYRFAHIKLNFRQVLCQMGSLLGIPWVLLEITWTEKQYVGSVQAEKVVLQRHEGVLCNMWQWLEFFLQHFQPKYLHSGLCSFPLMTLRFPTSNWISQLRFLGFFSAAPA